MVIDCTARGSGKRAERNGIRRTARRKGGRRLIDWCLRGRQELQQCGHLWPVPDRGLQNLASCFRRRPIQSESRTETAVSRKLIRTKEERAVLDDRTAGRAADLIFDTERCLTERFLIKIARGIQSIVVVKPESRTVEVVTAALGHNVHDRP